MSLESLVKNLTDRPTDDIAEGLYFQPEDWYHEGPGISKSAMDKINKSAQTYHKTKDHVFSNDNLAFGQDYHCRILEPEIFHRTRVVPIKVDRRTKAGKEAWKEWIEFNNHKRHVTRENMDKIEGMAEALLSHPVAGQLLSEGVNEVSGYARLYRGILSRVRVDKMREDMLIDLKTTVVASFREFQRSFDRYRYHVQAAYYLDVVSHILGRKISDFVIVAQEKEEPFEVATYVVDPEYIEIGREEYMSNLNTYIDCMDTGEWPGYPSEIVNMTPPHWRVLG